MKTIDIKLNLTIDGSFSELILPVESNMKLVDFFIALQLLLKKMSKEATTFDIYDTQFHRIAIIDDELELYIEEEYSSLNTVEDLHNVCIDTIEVIALGNRPIRKVLQEEEMLKYALDNYDIEDEGI